MLLIGHVAPLPQHVTTTADLYSSWPDAVAKARANLTDTINGLMNGTLTPAGPRPGAATATAAAAPSGGSTTTAAGGAPPAVAVARSVQLPGGGAGEAGGARAAETTPPPAPNVRRRARTLMARGQRRA